MTGMSEEDSRQEIECMFDKFVRLASMSWYEAEIYNM